MAEYEYVREIFNNCSRNQMRDVDFSEIEIDDVDAFMKTVLLPSDVIVSREIKPDGAICFDVDSSGMRQRFTFTRI